MKKIPVSVLIPAKNEIGNIEDCIASARFADEVVVVDSCSTDGTPERAAALGATVINFEWNGRFPKKKNWALENVHWRNEWVFILDADERITDELACEIEAVIAKTEHSGFFVNRKFMFMGQWIHYCGYYPSWNMRLFRHASGRYERLEVSGDTRSGDNEVHEHVMLNGTAGYLKADMLHYAYPTIDVWVEKHNRYSNWEARVENELHENSGEKLKADLFGDSLSRKRWIKKAARRLPFRPLLRFIYHYILRQGFRDGYQGFVLCRLLAWYEFVSIAKAREIGK